MRLNISNQPAILAVLVLLMPPAVQAQSPLKVFISADMEGVAGVVTGDQLSPTGFEYERFRGFMTAEALAAIQGARDAGATTVVVADAHGNGENLLIELLPDDVTVVRSWPRPHGMMEGIDSTFDAAVLIGYHAATTSTAGVRAHTLSSATLTSVALNDIAMPEAGISAAIAGHFGVPVVAISGDDVAVAEAEALLGKIEGAVVKTAVGFHAAVTMTPDSSAFGTMIGAIDDDEMDGDSRDTRGARRRVRSGDDAELAGARCHGSADRVCA